MMIAPSLTDAAPLLAATAVISNQVFGMAWTEVAALLTVVMILGTLVHKFYIKPRDARQKIETKLDYIVSQLTMSDGRGIPESIEHLNGRLDTVQGDLANTNTQVQNLTTQLSRLLEVLASMSLVSIKGGVIRYEPYVEAPGANIDGNRVSLDKFLPRPPAER